MYKIIQDSITGKATCVLRVEDNTSIPFDPANTDYQTFKAQINNSKTELEDADGNLMTPEAAQAFVATLP